MNEKEKGPFSMHLLRRPPVGSMTSYVQITSASDEHLHTHLYVNKSLCVLRSTSRTTPRCAVHGRRRKIDVWNGPKKCRMQRALYVNAATKQKDASRAHAISCDPLHEISPLTNSFSSPPYPPNPYLHLDSPADSPAAEADTSGRGGESVVRVGGGWWGKVGREGRWGMGVR